MICRITQEALATYSRFAAAGRVVVFDTETTGISRDDEIIQLAAAEYVNGTLVRTLNRYIVPSCMIHPEAEAVHHITMPFLVEHGSTPCAVLEQFFEFVGNEALLVGHNIRFDFNMLQNECRKFEFESHPEGLVFCDTIALAKRFVPGLAHYRLGFLLEALALEGTNSHNALDDALACGTLFFDLMKRIPFAKDDYHDEPLWEDGL